MTFSSMRVWASTLPGGTCRLSIVSERFPEWRRPHGPASNKEVIRLPSQAKRWRIPRSTPLSGDDSRRATAAKYDLGVLRNRGGTGAGQSRQSHEKPSGVTPGRLFPLHALKRSDCPALRPDIVRIMRTFHNG